jgi:hypothetical protein
MARIPTISAQSITGLPGTAGGVLLTRTGVSAVPISTPLTQRLNPAAFGKEGAAIAQLGQTIFEDGVLPAIILSKKNARAKQSLDESNRLYKEMSVIKAELAKNTPPGSEYLDLAWDTDPIAREKAIGGAWTKHWKGIDNRINNLLPSISNNVSDTKHAVALSNAFLPQIMSLKLKAQNRQVKVTEDRAIVSYQESQKTILAELMSLMPTKNEDGEVAYVFQGQKIANLLQRKELNDTVFANSGVGPLERQKEMDAAQKSMVAEVAGALQTDPRMGQEFLAKYGEALGMTEGEIGETIYKLEKFEFQHTRMELKKLDWKDVEMEQAAAKQLEPVKLDHLLSAIKGDLNLTTFVNSWADVYDRANMTGWYDDVYKLIADKETLPGETDPATLVKYEFKVQQALGDPNIDPDTLAGEIATEPKLDRAQKITQITKLAALKNNGALLKWSPYMQAKEYLQKSSPVPLDSTDRTASAIRSRAIWSLWSEDVNKLLMANKPRAFKQFDFFKRAQELINNHADLWGKPSESGAQIILNDTVEQSGLGDEPGVVVGGGGDSRLIFPDVDAMKVALLKNRSTMTKDQVRKALDAIRTLDTYPGLREKVTQLKQAEEQANQPKGPEPLSNTEKVLRALTLDEWEAWGKDKFPDVYRKIYGADQAPLPGSTPKAAAKEEPKEGPQEKPFFGDVMGAIDQGMVNSKEFIAAWQKGFIDPSNNFDEVLKGITKYRAAQGQDKGPKKDPQQRELFEEAEESDKDAEEPDIWMQDYNSHNAAGEKVLADLNKRGGSEVWINVARSLLADLKSAAESKNDKEFDAVWGNFKKVAKKIQDRLSADE